MIEIDITNEGIVIFANGGYTFLPIGYINENEN